MDSIKSILIEIRPRLRSCNFVILTNNDFVDKYHLKVCVRPNFIILNYINYDSQKLKKKEKPTKYSRRDSTSSCESYSDSEEEIFDYSKFINVSFCCKLMPNSLSSLKVESGFISFRVLTQPIKSDSGTFFDEVLNNDTSTIENSSEPVQVNLVNKEKTEIDLLVTDNVSLMCANCNHIISSTQNEYIKYISFSRILELPSDNLDMSDWFCHGDSNIFSNENCSNNSRIVPKDCDLFYGLCYFMINICNVSTTFLTFNEKRNTLHCDRCYFWLGIKFNPAFKLWNSCVKFCRIGTTENDIAQKSFHLFKCLSNSYDVALNDFLNVIKSAIKNSFVSVISSTCKFILECNIIDSKKKNFLIWILDKQLDMVKSFRNFSDCSSLNSENCNEIKLRQFLTCKLLYKIESDSNLVKSWMDDSTVQTYEISKDMFIEGKKHFEKMSSYIPHSFKKTNDFYVTYLDI